MLRRNFLAASAGAAFVGGAFQREALGQQAAAGSGVFLERSATGRPHEGKVLLAVEAHSDDVPLFASGTVAKLIDEGYTGYLVRATNDDMGDSPGLGTPGTIAESALGNERDTVNVAKAMGCKSHFNLDYSNHRMADVSVNEVISRMIFLIRLLRVDTVVCWDPWGHDEENPDHYTVAKAVEAACWMAGRDHDYEEQFAAGLKPKEVQDKYYFARRPEITRVVDISKQVDKKIDTNWANVAKGPGGHLGSRLRAELAAKGQKLALLGDDDATADRNYIREFVLAGNRELGKKYGVEYAEAFHYIPAGAAGADRDPKVEAYVKAHSQKK
jgi:LmbE family N-acetylglucosaminyl deacetylase